jgi:membrane protein required for colicin V production
MQAYDLIMLIVLGMSMIFGAIKGFAWQVASLTSIIVSYIVAYRFRFQVAEMIHAAPPWNQFLAMLILYVGTSFVIWVAFRLLSSMIDQVRLKEFDRHMGAAFGLAKGFIYCLLITMFAMSLLGPQQQSAICHSKSGFYIATALDKGVGILPKEIHDVVGPYLARLDEKLKDGVAGFPAGGSDGSTWSNDLPNVPGFSSSQSSQAGQGGGSGWNLEGMIPNTVPSAYPNQVPNGGPVFQPSFPPANMPALPSNGAYSTSSDLIYGASEGQSAQQPAYILPR